jgi:hypothetical protein
MLKIHILREAVEQKLNPIQQHNLNFLLNTRGVEAAVNDLDIYDQPDYIALVKNIPVLSKHRLVKFMTGRSFGKIFKLDNDHIFKMFSESLDPDEDHAWYKDSLKKLHKGTAKKTTLPVYDAGAWSGISKKIYWVEMAEVMPYDLWVKSTGRTQDEFDSKLLSQFGAIKRFYFDTHSSVLLDFAKWAGEARQDGDRIGDAAEELYRMLLGKENEALITKNEIQGILEALQDLDAAGWSMADVLPRNIGVLKQSNPSKPTFIIFDK